MDYIALNHNNHHPAGLIYNSAKPIGGLRYYVPRRSVVKVKTGIDGTPKVSVTIEQEIKEQTQYIKNEIEKYNSPEVSREIQEEVKAKIEETKARDSVRPVISNERATGEFIVEIGEREVNFSKENISRVTLSESDKDWLEKAQYYFLNAKDGDKLIGSAPRYTTMPILEALWATAINVGINPKRFIVQIYNESRFDPYAKGQSGERGIGQFKEETAKNYGFDWDLMKSGVRSYAYQAKASAEFIKAVGEVAYNGTGPKALAYQSKIDSRLDEI